MGLLSEKSFLYAPMEEFSREHPLKACIHACRKNWSFPFDLVLFQLRPWSLFGLKLFLACKI